MSPFVERRVWLEINLKTLKSNFAKIQAAVHPAKVVAVLKANAYGLGDLPVGKALAEAGCFGFGVAELSEALTLRPLGKPVQILGSTLRTDIPEAVRNDVILPITDLTTAQAIQLEAERQEKRLECHFLIDSGMGRLGILADEAVDLIREVVQLPNLNCEGIYSHFPVAYRAGEAFTENQVDRFLGIVRQLESEGIHFNKIHIANSDAVNNFNFTYKPPFNLVRTGINLHGSFDTEGHRVLNLESILTLKAKLVAVRTLPAGSTIGYGRTYQLRKETRVGTLAAGYADGLPMALSNRGYVLVHDRLCPVLGRVCMDYTTVSLDNVPEARPGDDVICLGGKGEHAITVDSWAQLKGTHPYDIICSFGSRVERRYRFPVMTSLS